jgi:hypothetical protein
VPVVAFANNVMPPRWLWAGPLKPKSLEIDFLEGVGGREKARPAPGLAASHGGESVRFAPTEAGHTWTSDKFTAGMEALDLTTILKNSWDSTALFYSVVENDRPRFAEFRLLTPKGEGWHPPERLQAAAWVGGVRVADGGAVKLPAGQVPVLVQAASGTLPHSGKIWMAPRLVDRTLHCSRVEEEHGRKVKAWRAYQAARGGETFVLDPDR